MFAPALAVIMTVNSHTTLLSFFDKLILYLFTSFIFLMLLLFLKLLRKGGCLKQEMLRRVLSV